MKMAQFVSITLVIILGMFLNTCGQMTSNDEGMASKSIEEASGTTDDSTTTGTTAQMGGSIQGVELSLSTVVTTLAGTGSSGSANGTGTSASFNAPIGLLQMEQTYMWQIRVIT